MGRRLIHINELHLIHSNKIHNAVAQLVESLDLAAGSTKDFNLYQLVETYFGDFEKREKINGLLGINKRSIL